MPAPAAGGLLDVIILDSGVGRINLGKLVDSGGQKLQNFGQTPKTNYAKTNGGIDGVRRRA